MAVVTSKISEYTKNYMLNTLNSMRIDDRTSTSYVCAYNNLTEQGKASFSFLTATGGSISKTSPDVVIEIGEGKTVNTLKVIRDNGVDYEDIVDPITITPTEFPYGGKIIITQITVTLT